MDLRKIYGYALGREFEGKRFFEENAARLTQAAAIDAFRRLVVEEQKHIDYIQRQIDAMELGQPANPMPDPELQPAEFFSDRALSEFLDRTVLEAMVPDLPVLRMAYLIERDFSEFYEKAASQAEGPARLVLETLAAWERRHEALFRQFHDEAFKLYAHMPWGG
jgi:rubrerythrin